jgi:hypothetical protein
MNFVNAWPMWTGLAALGVSVPVLIHLWSRNQKFETPWAAMELLKKAMIARSRKIQVEDYILMALRALALLLIAVALLRPIFNAAGSGGIGGRDVGVVIAIDASYSMNHGEPARFEKAIGQAREILATLQEGDPVSVVLMNQQPEVIFRRTGYDATAFNKALDELTKASPQSLNIERSLGLIDELVEELKTATRECYLITDAQASDWQALSGQAKSSLQKIGEGARLMLTTVPAPGVENLAITNFTYSAGSLQRGGSARFTADVRNTGSLRAEAANVEFFVEGTLKARQDLPPIEAGETRSVSFFTSFDNPGDIALSARLSKDALPDDNERFVIAKISPSIRVLCIDGDLPGSTRQDPIGGYYLVRALRLRHAIGEDAPVKVTHIDPSDLSRENLTEYEVVVLVDVPAISEDLGKRLAQFTESGGGLMVLLGDQLDAGQYNENLVGDGGPVLPARLTEVAKHDNPGEGWQIAPVKSTHPLAQVVTSLPRDLTATARFHTAVRAVPLPGCETILALDDGLPLLMTHQDPLKGRVMLFTSSADRSWNNLPLHPLFTILLQQSATMLSNDPQLGQGLVGEPAVMGLPGRMVGDDVAVTDPSGVELPVKATLVDGAPAAVITPDAVGIYRVAAEAGHRAAAVSANVDTRESDVRPGDGGALDRWLDGLPVDVVTQGVAKAALSHRTGRDLSLLLLALGVMVFLVQGVLANLWSRRKYESGGDVMATLQDRRVAASRRS